MTSTSDTVAVFMIVKDVNVTTTSTLPTECNAFAEGINLYVPPVLFVVGLVCNVLVILVMRTPFFVKVSTSTYISFTAFIDNVSLSIALPAHWIYVNFSGAIYRGSHSDHLCKFFNFIGFTTSDLGVVLTAAMTLERAVAMKFPLKAAHLCTVKKAKYIIGGLVVAMVLKDIHFVLKSQLVPETVKSHLCELNTDNEAFKFYAEQFWPILHNVILLTSFVIIAASNVIIVKSVKDSGAFPNISSQISSTSTGQHHRHGDISRRRLSAARGRQLTFMLISDSLTIVICTLPFSIVTIVMKDIDVSRITFAICFYLLYVNRCANFFLYCISGERFRNALKQICGASAAPRSMSVYSIVIGARSDRRLSTFSEPSNSDVTVSGNSVVAEVVN